MDHENFSSLASDALKSALGNRLLPEMLDAIPSAVCILGIVREASGNVQSFEYLFANKAAAQLEPLKGKQLQLKDDPFLFTKIADVAVSGNPEDFLHHYQSDPDRWIHYSISKIDNGILLAYENVTNRKNAAIALRRERSQMAEAQSICNAGSFEVDLIGNKIYWSDEMFRIHGLEPQSQSVAMENALGMIHPDDVSRIAEKLESHSKSPSREEMTYRLKLPNGETRHIRTRLQSFRGDDGRMDRISGMALDVTDRKLTEAELRNVRNELKKQAAGKEKREAILEDFGRIIESVHDAIVSTDQNGYIVTWNTGAEKMYGYTRDEAIGRSISKLIVPEARRERFVSLMETIFNDGGRVTDFATLMLGKHGKELEVLVNIVPLKNPDGKVTGAATTSKNVSAEKHRAILETEIVARTQALQQSEALLKATLDSTLDVIQVFQAVRDESGKIIDFTWILTNKKWNEKNGDVIGKRLLLENPGAETSGVFDRFIEVVETGIPQRHEHRYSLEQFDGWFDQEIVKLNDGVVMATEDITQRKIAESKLSERNSIIKSMTTATPDIMFLMDIETKKVLFATKNMAEIMGYDQSQIGQMNNQFLDIMHPEDRPSMIAHVERMKTAADGEVREIKYRILNASGSIHWFVDRNVVYKRDENGVPIEKMGITHDIDSRVKADEKIHLLNRSLIEKNRELRALHSELKTFTTVAAYDYKDTLGNLYTNLEFIISREAQSLSNAGKANLRKAQTAIQKMKLLTDDIVEFSKVKTPDESPSMVDLNNIVNTALDELSDKIAVASPNITIDNLPEIKGYPFLLDLLFSHLIDNAIKFRNLDEKLKISITHSLSNDRHTGQDVHSVTVSDNGIGFPQEEASKIVDMFYRIHGKKYKGSGIGLAICKKITDLHGGTMAIESEPGKGTTVCCFFPVI